MKRYLLGKRGQFAKKRQKKNRGNDGKRRFHRIENVRKKRKLPDDHTVPEKLE